MAHSDYGLIYNKNDKEIEDVIDARKKIGQYDIIFKTEVDFTPIKNSLSRNAYSTTVLHEDDKEIIWDDTALWFSEGVCYNSGEPEIFNIGRTDSEITVVRVKREGLQYKSGENMWNLHDDAVPGDGSHLGESPSLVNLVTLVGQSFGNKILEYNEYLVPLSSWDPCDNPYLLPDMVKETVVDNQSSNLSKLHIIKSPKSIERRLSLTGRIANYLRKRCARK